MLALRGGGVLLLLWAVGVLPSCLNPAGLSRLAIGLFFSTTMIENRKEVDYYDIFIPSNPFNSMSRNYVPAVVVFSICIVLLTTLR